MRLDFTKPPKIPPTREELLAKQQARVERIEDSSRFPWRRLIVALFLSALAVIVVGGGILSLIMAITIVSVTMRGSIKSFGSPLKK
jgi:hypothetical protein